MAYYNGYLRRLIVNADDFGLTAGVNRAIVEAHSGGIVTSATLMANSSAFSEAVALAKSAPDLSIGCHVVLVDGSSVSDPTQIPSLLRPDGKFHDSLATFARLALQGKLDADQIEMEVVSQIRKVQAAGIDVSHVDTHKHTHMFPPVLRSVLRAAKTCGVPAIRNPFETVKLSHLFEYPDTWKRWFEVRTLRSFSAKFHQAVKDAGLHTPDGTVGIIATGSLGQRFLEFLLKNLPEGTWELVCHPGYNDEALGHVRTRLRESRERELRALTSANTRRSLAQQGVELISYSQVAPSSFRVSS
jgi:hopanoid biosynthesis associated protein HpnK